MPRRRDVSPDELNRIIQLRQSRTSWLKIEHATSVPRQIAKREYEAWEHNQSRKELKQARIQVATSLFSEHLEYMVRLAEALVNNMPETMTPFDVRDAETVVNDILAMFISNKPEEPISVTLLEQQTAKAQRRILRQNEMLFRSLRDHTREGVDWQVLEKWKAGWNTSRAAMNVLRFEAGQQVQNFLDNQKTNVRDKIAATEVAESILANMVAGIFEVVRQGTNDSTAKKLARLVQIKKTREGRVSIMFGESGSPARIELTDFGLAKDVAEICRWVSGNLSIKEREGQIRLYHDGITAMKDAIKKLEDMLDPLMLRPMILRTTCDLCPA
jgi:hypothetical protein